MRSRTRSWRVSSQKRQSIGVLISIGLCCIFPCETLTSFYPLQRMALAASVLHRSRLGRIILLLSLTTVQLPYAAFCVALPASSAVIIDSSEVPEVHPNVSINGVAHTGWHCTDNANWTGDGMLDSHCRQVIHGFYNEIYNYQNAPHQFIARNAMPYGTLPVVQTPLKLTYGTFVKPI